MHKKEFLPSDSGRELNTCLVHLISKNYEFGLHKTNSKLLICFVILRTLSFHVNNNFYQEIQSRPKRSFPGKTYIHSQALRPFFSRVNAIVRSERMQQPNSEVGGM